MKYCEHCGVEVHEEAVICPKCGCSLQKKAEKERTNWADVLGIIGLVLSILATIEALFSLIPILGLAFSSIALGLGFLGLAMGIVGRVKANFKGKSTTAIVLSSISLAVAALRLIFWFSLAAGATI